jgi:hypothetical protein
MKDSPSTPVPPSKWHAKVSNTSQSEKKSKKMSEKKSEKSEEKSKKKTMMAYTCRPACKCLFCDGEELDYDMSPRT